MHQLGEGQEGELMTALLRLQGRSAQVATLVAADAVQRGVLLRSDAANTAQWLGKHIEGVPVEPKTVRAMASVADSCRDRKNTVIKGALLEGACSVESARTALTQADKVGPVIPTAERDEVLGWFLQIDPALGSAGLTQLTRRIIARFAPDELSKDDEKLERTESLSWSTTPTGMTRVVAELSPANAAIFKDAVTAGSAPRPAKPADDTPGSAFGLGGSDHQSQDNPVRDERSPGKRRLDALMDLVGAGARAATGEGTQAGAATVLLTMGLETLSKGQGGATTTGGDTVDAGAARRFACSADLIPAVLGGPSAPLDVGRRERLATKAIRAAVILRDGGCSFPGCDRPPGFCEVHHVRPWWAGGETSLTNSALLCCRHHQVVHRQGYTAVVELDGVRWDLTPGRMPGHHTAAA
ncbi:HNH endonuclease signature motif containing protein [Flexivirga lutea]